MATSIQVTLPEAAAAAISTPAAAADADLVTKSNSDAHSTDLQTQLSDRLYLKPDTVSSAIYHADTEVDTDNEDADNPKPDDVTSAQYHADTDIDDVDYDVDTSDGNRKRSLKKPSVEEEEDYEVNEGRNCYDVDHSSCKGEQDEVKYPSISFDHEDDDNIQGGGGNKRDLEPNHLSSNNINNQAKKRQKIGVFTGMGNVDLSDVPPQPPIPLKPFDHSIIKEGASKYAGVSYDKAWKKWRAGIWINGKYHQIGYYEIEEEAGADYARALLKYQDQKALAKKRNSKYIPNIGVYFNKAEKKWMAAIRIDGKYHLIGKYETEEEAAVHHVRAVLKYHGQEALAKKRNPSELAIDKSDVPQPPPILKLSDCDIDCVDHSSCKGKQDEVKYPSISFDHEDDDNIQGGGGNKRDLEPNHLSSNNINNQAKKRQKIGVFTGMGNVDLSDVPPQPPIPLKPFDHSIIKEGASKYAGVSYDKAWKKWRAGIWINGKYHQIGYYEIEEEAGADYARALLKYQDQKALAKKRNSKYIPNIGVYFNKAEKKWMAAIRIDGKYHLIGKYETEEEAAVHHVRAVLKYHGQEALAKKRNPSELAIDKSDVPQQHPILNCNEKRKRYSEDEPKRHYR